MASSGEAVCKEPSAHIIAHEDDAEFDTPPESPDSPLNLSPRLQAELDELQSTEEYIKKSQEWIAKSNESVKELEVTMQKLMGHTNSRKQELENRTNKIKEMKKEIEEISPEAIEKEEEELKKLIDKEKTSKSPDDTDNDERISELLMKMEAYQEKLGIQIHTSEGCIEFIFTGVDTQCPNNVYTIKLALEGPLYKCISCEPPIDKVQALLEDLNQNHNLQQFITAIRREFKLLVNKEN
ncbi:kinetochore protein Spc25-like [Watersipora subatra]|uniref:kinetochore protein Spc25-like n=1 Tax=Watersipora subatra TaxID=2589382 RepID=UPI00355C658D